MCIYIRSPFCIKYATDGTWQGGSHCLQASTWHRWIAPELRVCVCVFVSEKEQKPVPHSQSYGLIMHLYHTQVCVCVFKCPSVCVCVCAYVRVHVCVCICLCGMCVCVCSCVCVCICAKALFCMARLCIVMLPFKNVIHYSARYMSYQCVMEIKGNTVIPYRVDLMFVLGFVQKYFAL